MVHDHSEPDGSVVLQEIAKEETERGWSFQSFLDCHSKEFGNQGHLASHISFFHALHLPFPHDIHDLEALECLFVTRFQRVSEVGERGTLV